MSDRFGPAMGPPSPLHAILRASRHQPRLRAAARAWLWLMDGAILDWLEHRDLERG